MSSAKRLLSDDERLQAASARLDQLIHNACALYPRADFSARLEYIKGHLMDEMSFALMFGQPPSTLTMEIGRRIRSLRRDGEPAPTQGRGQQPHVTHPGVASPKVESLGATQRRIRLQNAENRLYRMQVNGKPIAENYVFELRAAIITMEHRITNESILVLFLKNLVANLPGNELIGDHYRDAEAVEQIWQRSETVYVVSK